MNTLDVMAVTTQNFQVCSLIGASGPVFDCPPKPANLVVNRSDQPAIGLSIWRLPAGNTSIQGHDESPVASQLPNIKQRLLATGTATRLIRQN